VVGCVLQGVAVSICYRYIMCFGGGGGGCHKLRVGLQQLILTDTAAYIGGRFITHVQRCGVGG
jgi:hypothetical protein